MGLWVVWVIFLSSLTFQLEASSGAVLTNRPAAKKAFAQPTFNSEMVMESVGQFMTYLRNGQFDDAYQKSTSRKYRATTSWENFWSFIHQYPKFVSNLEIEMEGVVFRDGYALFSAFLLNQDKMREFYLEAHSEIEANRWKIMGLKIVELSEKDKELMQERKTLTLQEN